MTAAQTPGWMEELRDIATGLGVLHVELTAGDMAPKTRIKLAVQRLEAIIKSFDAALAAAGAT